MLKKAKNQLFWARADDKTLCSNLASRDAKLSEYDGFHRFLRDMT
jgi:hypothetical protein